MAKRQLVDLRRFPLARTHSYFYSGAVHVLYGEEIYQGSSFPSQQVWHQNR